MTSRGYDGASVPALCDEVDRLRLVAERIDRTVAYLRELLGGPLDSTTATVAEACILGLTND